MCTRLTRAVLAQGGVFMLFYDCIDPNSVLSSDVDSFLDPEDAAGPTVAEDGRDIGVEELAVSLETVASLIAESADKQAKDNRGGRASGQSSYLETTHPGGAIRRRG